MAGTGDRGDLRARQMRALFEPRGVVVAGASAHPGKFGFVTLHNLLAAGYRGHVAATNREGVEVLGVRTLRSLDDLPEGRADLVFVCTPAAGNPELLRVAAKKGITAAFIASAGYGEMGEEGRRAQEALAALADDLGLLVVGPNGQGVVSTPVSLCAQIVAPYPPRGRIAIVSQSGNFVSTFMNYAVASGVGVSRAVSAGNAAQVGVIDFLEHFAADPETDVALAYVEGVADGRDFAARLRAVCERKPVVLVKGGATAGGARAAASHTGSLATDDRVFTGMCRQAGAVRATTVEEAFEVAAAFATQPLPAGPRVAVVSTVGGWGVVTADAIAGTDLELLSLPEDLRAELDGLLPPRWSRGNPIDMAGGETKDTVPAVLGTAARHRDVDAVVFLGMGIQGNEAAMERGGPFWPDHGLERIVDFHARQDERYMTAADDLITELGKPVLAATELALAQPDNPAVRAMRARGRYVYPSSNRAVLALARMWWYGRWRERRGLGPLGGPRSVSAPS